MKRHVFRISSVFMLAWFAAFAVQAQFDDIYFDPDQDDYYVDTYATEDEDTYVTENYYYDDDEYDYYDDQEYTSRIQRFNRPTHSFGFYSPFYMYDPFMFNPYNYGGGFALSLGFGYGNWNRWNRYRYGYDPFFYDPFYNPYWGAGRAGGLACYFGGPSYGYGYGGLYGRNNYYVNNYYGNNYYGRTGYDYYQPRFDQINRGSYYGARRSGAVKASPGSVVRSPRNTTTEIANTTRQATDRTAVRTGNPRTIDGITGDTRSSVRTSSTRAVTKRYDAVRTPSTSETRRSYDPNRSARTVTRSSVDRSSARTFTRPNRSSSDRSYAPSTTRRTYSPATSRRSYNPARSTNRKSYSPSRSSNNRSYTPSRTSSPNRSYSPSRSSTPTPSRSSSRTSSNKRSSPRGNN